MTRDELETNLGTIAKSGSELFKEQNDKQKDMEIIGQFGVGFYSSFMVAKEVEVLSRSIYESDANYGKVAGKMDTQLSLRKKIPMEPLLPFI